MTSIRGPLARLDRSREELAKAWIVRLIERASLDQIRDLPTDRIARELPELIGDLVSALGDSEGGRPVDLSRDAGERAAGLAALRSGRDSSPADVARDVAALQAVVVRGLRDEVGEADPAAFGELVERLAEAAGAVQAAAAEELVRSRSRELESLATTDPLTGLHNLRHLQREISHLVEVNKRYGQSFALLVLDVDGLRRINDAHGSQGGDRALMQVAMSVRRSVRAVDTAARLSGDEFCVLAPQQDSARAATLADRLAAAVGGEVPIPDAPPVTVSIGVVACPEHGEEPGALVDAADRAMYKAKAAGERIAVGDVKNGETRSGSSRTV